MMIAIYGAVATIGAGVLAVAIPIIIREITKSFTEPKNDE